MISECTDPGLEAAAAEALSEFFVSKSQDGVRICNANSLSRYWAEEDMFTADRSEPINIPFFFSAEELEECQRAAAMSSWRVDETSSEYTMPEALLNLAHDKSYPDGHITLYLHRDGFFQRNCPMLFGKLVREMHSLLREEEGDDLQTPLNVRCAELHTYVVGGGLRDPGHRDNGSVLTMSVLLSDPRDFDGGQFVTYMDGFPVYHEMAKGDALLFRSEKLHNVSTVTRGMRQSLVVELWRQPANTQNRFA